MHPQILITPLCGPPTSFLEIDNKEQNQQALTTGMILIET
jgi:hypothetical protein